MTYSAKNNHVVRQNGLAAAVIGMLVLTLLAPTQPVFAQSVNSDVQGLYVPFETEPVMTSVNQPTVQQVLLEVCTQNGYGEDCAKTLLGMLWNESSNISNAIGDNGRARGYFQIHYKLHNVSIECAEDLVCSANWTIDYMEQHSYPKYVKYAVQCHNSCNVNNGYAAKALRNGKNFWNRPLEVRQSMPIQLASK